MGKNDFLSPKAIGNRIKAKGLQKLRWYCQMCNKQCRDENGFKCHQMSESHLQQMKVFGANPHRVIDGYSDMFLDTFVNHLKVAHRHTRMAAVVVYNEYISDKHHVHMNATKWPTLTDFVQFLGREGYCKVEDTPKGWFIQLIVNNPFENIKEEKRLKREREEGNEEARKERELLSQVERAHKETKTDAGPSASELVRGETDGKLAFGLAPNKLKASASDAAKSSVAVPNIFTTEEERNGGQGKASSSGAKGAAKGGGGALAEIMEAERRRAEADLKKKEHETPAMENWITEGIVVKVMSKALREKGHYKAKGVVLKVIDTFVAELRMLDSGVKVRVDQAELETVIPNLGGAVRVVNGVHRGTAAKVVAVDVEQFSARVQLTGGPHEGRQVSLPYEHICKTSAYS